MGAAWRELGNKKKAFDDIVEMVERVSAEGLEVCATLGMPDAAFGEESILRSISGVSWKVLGSIFVPFWSGDSVETLCSGE